MRHLLKILVGFSLVIALASCATGNKTKTSGWSGTITYDLSYEGDDITPVMTAQLPKTSTIKYYQDMSSMETVMGPMVQTIINKPSSKKTIIMVEYGLKKVASVVADTLKKDTVKEYETHVELVNETKTIAGHECKKAVITETPTDPNSDKEEVIWDLYYATDMDGSMINTDGEESKIPGVPLQFQINQNGMIMKFVAKEVKNGGVSDLDFMIPSDYKVVPADKMQEEFTN